MLEGGIQADDLVVIIGEQAIQIRILQQEKKELGNQILKLIEDKLELQNEISELREMGR